MAASDSLGQQFFIDNKGKKLKFEVERPQVVGHWNKNENGAPTHWVDEPEETGRHHIYAKAGNNVVLGHLGWDKERVTSVDVSDNWQRRGIATQMFRKAQEITPNLAHSNNRTDSGDAWAKKVGGEVPERMQDHPEWFRIRD